MFENIGGKIKVLAVVVCIIGIILSVFYALNLWASGYNNSFWLGLVALVGGSVLSWIGSFFAYGFGELIERTCSIDDKLSKAGSSVSTMIIEKDSSGRDVAMAYNSRDAWSCPKCKTMNPKSRIECRECGTLRP